jgi:PAS domain S-box-containing protein
MDTTIDDPYAEIAALRRERDIAVAEKAALAEILEIINRSPGDPQPVFDAILEKAHTLCHATSGGMALHNGRYMVLVAAQGLPAPVVEMLRQPFGAGTGKGFAHGRRYIHVPDLRAIDWPPDEWVMRSLVEHTDTRSRLAIPLRKAGAFLGLISFNFREVRSFSDQEIALLENFAAQAVIAIENARLLTEQREALERQTATAEVLQVINASSGDLAPVFEAIVEKAHVLCDAAFGALITYDGDTFQVAAERHLPPAWAELIRGPFRPGPKHPISRLARGEPSFQIEDFQELGDVLAAEPSLRAGAELGGIRSILYVPLRKDGALLGLITAYRQEVRTFTDKQVALLESFAAQAVIAMENARLLNELRARTDELAQRQAELRVTFENMADGVAMFDETPRLVAWNRNFQEILDLPDGLLAERLTFSDYIHYLARRGEFDSEVDPDAELRRLTARAGERYALERTRPNGRVIELRHNPVAGGGFVIIYADITERKRNEAAVAAARDAAEDAARRIEAAYRELQTAQANLVQAEKMASLGKLTAGIAHEIKNPLNFVNNFAALSVDLLGELKEAAAPALAALAEEQQAEVDDLAEMLTGNLQKIVQHGKRADGIVRAMLEHSRGASGERRMVDLNALIDEALNLAYHGARAQNHRFSIELERDYAAEIGLIEVNPQDMTRVFLNMFNNGFYAAAKRARAGAPQGFAPTLRVTTADLGHAVEIRVRDNGIGIPASIRDSLFEPFFSTKPTGEGTGLGLSITYDIVTKQHGGTITVASEVDRFAEFVVTLPRGTSASDTSRA